MILFGAPSEGDTVVVSGNTFTFSAVAGANKFANITELNALITALANVNSVQNGYAITITAATAGVAGNSITLAKTGNALDISGATLTGGVDADSTTSDTHLNSLILAAEIYIDAYAGYWQKYDETQDRTFPRQGDYDSTTGETEIPEAVKFATIAQLEFMFENMPDRDHGVEQDEKPTKETISPRVKILMKGYVNRTGVIELPNIQHVTNVPEPVPLSGLRW